MRVAVLNNNVVSNIIVWPDGEPLPPDHDDVTDKICVIGATKNGAAYDLPTPEPAVQSWTALEFKRRFTAAERITMRTAAQTDPVMADFLDILDTTGLSGSKVYADDVDLIAGMAYTVAQGHITQARSDEVLGV